MKKLLYISLLFIPLAAISQNKQYFQIKTVFSDTTEINKWWLESLNNVNYQIYNLDTTLKRDRRYIKEANFSLKYINIYHNKIYHYVQSKSRILFINEILKHPSIAKPKTTDVYIYEIVPMFAIPFHYNLVIIKKKENYNLYVYKLEDYFESPNKWIFKKKLKTKYDFENLFENYKNNYTDSLTYMSMDIHVYATHIYKINDEVKFQTIMDIYARKDYFYFLERIIVKNEFKWGVQSVYDDYLDE